jgi:hypothetical protein
MNYSGRPYLSFRSATDPNKILGGSYLGNARASDPTADAPVMHLQVPMYTAHGLFDGQLYLSGGLYNSMIVGGMSFVSSVQNTTNYPPPPPPMPYLVPFVIDPSGTYFHPGDNITVDTVYGTENTIEPKNVYRVQGRYTLSSATLAYLAVIPGYTDIQGDPHSGDIDPDEGAFEAQGSGTYSFILRMRHPGVPHVTFYPAIGGSSSSSISFTNAAPTTQPTPSAQNEILEVDFTMTANVQRDADSSQPNIQQPNVQQSNVSPPIAKRSTKGQH